MQRGKSKILKMLDKKTQPENVVNTANVDKAKNSNDTKISFPSVSKLAIMHLNRMTIAVSYCLPWVLNIMLKQAQKWLTLGNIHWWRRCSTGWWSCMTCYQRTITSRWHCSDRRDCWLDKALRRSASTLPYQNHISLYMFDRRHKTL